MQKLSIKRGLAMYCSHCGNKLSDIDAYCATCGKPVRQNKIISTPTDDNSADQKDNANYHSMIDNFSKGKIKSEIEHELTNKKKKKIAISLNIISILICIISIRGINVSIIDAIRQDGNNFSYVILLLLLTAGVIGLAKYGIYKITNICYAILDVIKIH